MPAYWGIDLPILLLVGGVLVGILLALLCRALVDLTARSRAGDGGPQAPRRRARGLQRAGRGARSSSELDAFRTVRTGLDKALGS